MPRGQSTIITYEARDNQGLGVPNDQANHTLVIVRDADQLTPSNVPTWLSGGRYQLRLTAEENDGEMMTVDGTSSTSNVTIIPAQWQNEIFGFRGTLPGTSVPPDFSSLSSVEDANDYFSKKIYTKAWFAKSDEDKQKCLNEATQIIDSYSYLGSKTDPNQAHEWPRSGIYINDVLLSSETLPFDILYAQYEIANAIAKGYDPDKQANALFVTSRSFASVRTSYDLRAVPEYLKLGIPSAIAWKYLLPYFNRRISDLRLLRVSG